MKRIFFLLIILFVSQHSFAQDTLLVAPKTLISDASYAGGNVEDLYYYVNNNFNYNNVKKEDVPNKFKKRSYFVFYVSFAISEDGKAFEFSPKEITEENSFYKEAVRVIASARWNTATKDGQYLKQFLVLPIRASLSDF
ncbi:MAG TPA: hypothetical protein VLY87_04090 [Flavobacterium sp.]|nr:hypothetical protein [Flavobacterium sp.]